MAVVSGLATLLMVLAIPVGSAQATLAPTPVPYMGWNTYYGVGGSFQRGDDQVGGQLADLKRIGAGRLQDRLA